LLGSSAAMKFPFWVFLVSISSSWKYQGSALRRYNFRIFVYSC